MLGTVPDLLRLVAVPVFGWAAYRDVKTRRVPNRTWLPLAVVGVVALAWDLWLVLGDPFQTVELYALRVALSLGIIVPLAYGFWLFGGFGGADVKALAVLALLFPTYPTYYLPWTSLPVVETTVGVFALTVLSNTVVAGLAFPFVLAARNAVAGDAGALMFVAKRVPSERVVEEYGAVLRPSSAESLGDRIAHYAGMNASRRGLDLDALRMYLQWRGCSLADVRADPDRYRDPATLPAEPNPPGDGGLATDGGHPPTDPAADEAADAAQGDGDAGARKGDGDAGARKGDGDAGARKGDGDVDAGRAADAGYDDGETATDYDDPWGAAAFLEDIEGSAYRTDPEELRWGLDHLASEDAVWVSPGTPFIVPMFVGLVVSLLYGDVLFAIIRAIGL